MTIPIRKEIQIIYINGPSSSGKTSLGKTLQQQLPEPHLLLGIDKIIGWMPEKLNNWDGDEAKEGFSWKPSLDPEGYPTHELQVGPYAEKVVKAFHEIVLGLAEKGYKLIIDDVAVRTEVQVWKAMLKDYCVLWVGIHAALEVLEEREKLRDRMKGSARAQFYTVHKDAEYDIEVDTTSLSSLECAQQILRKMGF